MKQSAKHKIGIVGIGMVGGPIAKYFEEIMGHGRNKDLFLYDTDPKKGFSDDVNSADIIFVSVPSPRSHDGSCDISMVENAVSRINGEKTIVIKSTIPPGTTEELQKKYGKHKFLFNPEFLTERQAWEDFIKPDRQIVGFTDKSMDAAYAVLSILPKAPFMSPWGINTYKPIKITATEAEIIKYGSNIYFVRKVNFANVLSDLSKKLEADYENVRTGMSADFRIGDSHLDVNHGGYKGFGGYCFPKDLDAFISHLRKNGLTESANFLENDKKFNENLLNRQGLTLEEVSVHDHEWIKNKLKNAN